MPTLSCPRCGHSGEIKGTDHAFEIRGQWPDGHHPVRKCRECGAGIIVHPRLLIFGARAELIPDELWARMEEMFSRAVGGVPTNEKPFVCDDCGKGFKTQRACDAHAADAHAG